MTPDERLELVGISREDLAARVAQSRASQGLPARVENRSALARMAALVARRP